MDAPVLSPLTHPIAAGARSSCHRRPSLSLVAGSQCLRCYPQMVRWLRCSKGDGEAQTEWIAELFDEVRSLLKRVRLKEEKK